MSKLSLPTLNHILEAYKEETELWVEALEALAPENFAEKHSGTNFSNYFSVIFRNPDREDDYKAAFRLYNHTHSGVLSIDTQICGLCHLFHIYFEAVGCPKDVRIQALDELSIWWSENYQHHSGDNNYPVSHPYFSIEELFAYKHARNLWGTKVQYAHDIHHAIYCERRYQLVQCTAEYLRHLLALQDTQR